MTDPLHNDDHRTPELDRLESLVRAAGGYIEPSDNLRPSTLEAAREACRQQRTTRRLGGLALVVVVLAATGLPWLRGSSGGGSFVGSDEMYRRASIASLDSSVGTHWALYEVFRDARLEKAERLNHAD